MRLETLRDEGPLTGCAISQPHARNVSDSVDSKLNSAAYEAANLAEHSHPHMVRLHEYQHCDGWPTMLLELGSLGSLEDVMDALRSRGEYMPEVSIFLPSECLRFLD
jgi:serine/threonine protein kinase